MKIAGYAAVFNSRSVDLGGFVEVIKPGAFARTLADGHPIFAVHHHQFADVMGSTRSGSLRLSEDSRGLHFDLELPDTSLGRDIHALVKRGDLASMSFSFHVLGTDGERWRELPNGMVERELLDVYLHEISTVALPAYPATKVSARAGVVACSRRNALLRRHLSNRLEAVASSRTIAA